MEELLTKIGELISMEIEDVKDVEYMNKDIGYILFINMKDGKKVMLSLMDTEINQ